MSLFFALLLAAAAGAWQGRRPAGRRIALAAAVAMFVWGSDPFTTFFAWTLERQVDRRALPAGDAQAIVVLSGSFYPPDETQPEILPGYGTYLRCEHAARLYREWKALPVVVTAGPVEAHGTFVDGAVAMRRTLEDEGVPAAMIWTENQSHTTYDNARYTAQLLRGKGIGRIALVTEAFHMPRALRAFRRAGLETTAAACAFRSERFEASWSSLLLPRPANMVANEELLHEWIGLAWYRVTGRG